MIPGMGQFDCYAASNQVQPRAVRTILRSVGPGRGRPRRGPMRSDDQGRHGERPRNGVRKSFQTWTRSNHLTWRTLPPLGCKVTARRGYCRLPGSRVQRRSPTSVSSPTTCPVSPFRAYRRSTASSVGPPPLVFDVPPFFVSWAVRFWWLAHVIHALKCRRSGGRCGGVLTS